MRILMLACLLLLPGLAQAEKRLGLVIGNNDYASVPALEKAEADAEAIAATLDDLGFETTLALNTTRREMNRAISIFTGKIEPGDTAMVFYAGHGVQIAGENYLLPTDIEAGTTVGEDFVKSESVALSDLVQRVKSAGARTTLMFIDACRDNPFEIATGRSIGGTRGLALVAPPEGTFMVFSAGAGQQALDRLAGQDDDPNSVFTRLLLPKLQQSSLELRQLVSELRREVRDLALTQNHPQFPAYYDELLGDFFFSGSRSLRVVAPPQALQVERAPEPEVAPQPDVTRAEPEVAPEPEVTEVEPEAAPVVEDRIKDDFDLVRSVDTAEAYAAFIARYEGRDDLVITLAKSALERLEKEAKAEAEAAKAEARVASRSTPNVAEEAEAKAAEEAPAGETEVAAAEPDPVPSTLPPRPDPAAARREVIRETQRRLAALGCRPGGADGVIGPQTRRAFTTFVEQSGSSLTTNSLGTKRALNELNRSNTRCRIAAAKPKPPQATSLAGQWRFRAQCPLYVNSNGTYAITWTGPNTYSVVIKDNLGQTAWGQFTESNGWVNGANAWSTGARTTYRGRLSADRRSISGSTSVGCNYQAWKVN
ncbi:MAG: caspase family protein [Pseudomonadota bacterium]